MKCDTCGRRFRDGDKVLPVKTYVVNEKRGDFVGSNASAYICAEHVKVA